MVLVRTEKTVLIRVEETSDMIKTITFHGLKLPGFLCLETEISVHALAEQENMAA